MDHVNKSALERSAERIKAPDEDWLDQFARVIGRNILEGLALEFEQHPFYHREAPTSRIFTGKEIARILRTAKDKL